MKNRAIVLCAIALLAAACSSSKSLPLSQEGPTPPSKGGASVSPVHAVRSLAEQGNAEAQFNLGLLYDRGHGVPKDKHEALRWYRRAATQGDTFAQNSLGDNYWEGTGVPKDDREAAWWWRLAADKGIAPAQHSLGKMLSGGGQGVPADKTHAYMWLMLSAVQGDEEAGRQGDILSKQLKPDEMTNAKKLVKQWKATSAGVGVNKITQEK